MKKLSIYLDTSVINFLYADDAPEKRDATKDFFQRYVSKGVYNIYISPIVIDEINKTKDDIQKSKLLGVITDYGLPIIDISSHFDEIQHLADAYIEQGIVPSEKVEDALHIAISTVYEMDVLLSWNYQHLANLNKERKIISMNIQQGYLKTIRLTTPLEVMSDEE